MEGQPNAMLSSFHESPQLLLGYIDKVMVFLFF